MNGAACCDTAVGLCGPRGSGKTTIAAQLVHSYGFTGASFGCVVKREAIARGIDPSIERLQDLGAQLIDEWGWRKFCTIVLADAAKSTNVVIDGVRHAAAVQALRNLFGKRFILVYVEVAETTRLARLSLREGSYCLERDHHHIELEVAGLKAGSDLVVRGEGTGTAEIVRYLQLS